MFMNRNLNILHNSACKMQKPWEYKQEQFSA